MNDNNPAGLDPSRHGRKEDYHEQQVFANTPDS